MTNFKTNSSNDIYSLMEEFPFLSFADIKETALSLSIQGVYNEESTLTESNYALLKNKLLEEHANHNQDFSAYEEYEQNNLSIDTSCFELKDKDCISIREIQLKHKLKEAFIFQSINLLNIKDIHENPIENTTDTNYIYVSEDDSEKIIKKTNQLNAMNANKNNPSLNNQQIPANTMTMNKLAEKYNISLSVLISIARDLGIAYIYNGNSYTHIDNCMKIVEKAQNKLNSFKVVEKVSDTREEFTIFEELIEKETLVFVDTSSLMNDEMPQIMNNVIIPTLQKYNKTIFITDSVINEIMVKINQVNNEENQRKAFSARDILSKLVEDDLYQIPQTHSVNKHFADAELISIFSDLRLKYNLCLITNDNSSKKGGGLSNCITKLQTSTCMDEGSIKKITVLYVANEKLVEYSSNRDINFKLHKKSPARVIL